MNWIKRLIKTAAAQSKINKLGIANPALKFFVHRYENAVGIDWNQIKSPGDIETYIYSKLLPELYKKIDPNSDNNNYLKPEHLDLASEMAEHGDDPQVQAARRIYERDPEAAAKHVLSIINDGKKEGFNQWWNYLTQEDEIYRSNPAFMYSILKPIIDSSPETAKNSAPPLNSEALAAIWEEITENGVTQMNVLKNYRKISSKLDSQDSETVSTGGEGEWIKIPSKISDPANYEANLSKLRRYANGTGWCIAQNHHSNQYLSQGDFWLYLVDGRAMIAIRMIGDDKVQEIRGHHNSDKNLEPYWQEITQFLHKTNFDYKDNTQYKIIEDIFLMNKNLEKGTPDYKLVADKIRKDHTVYLRVSEENRKKFPEFLDIAKNGYRADINEKLLEIEAPGLNEGAYLSKFENFQDYYKKIPEEIKVALGDMNERLLQAHKKAYHNNPIIFPEFDPEMQKQFSKEEQISAWRNYVDQDPYHYNDKRIPKDIRPYFSADILKEKWKNLILKNAEHIDYIPPEIFKLFAPGEVEGYVLKDFASFPVSSIHGRLDKLDRMEKLIAQGRISKEQVVDILAKSIRQNPEWMNRLPENYKTELMQQTNVKTIVEQGEMKHIIRDTGYFKSLPLETQNTILQQYGPQIGEAFARDQSKYRGLLHEFWINTPANVRPYLPDNIIENVAQFYTNAVNGSLSTFQNIQTKIPTDIHSRIIPKLAYKNNWYKKAQKIPTVEDIYWAMDDIWLNQIFTEEDITNILDSNLRTIIQAKENNYQQYQSKAAQVATKNRKQKNNTLKPINFDYKKTKKKLTDELKKEKKNLDLSMLINNKNLAKVIGTHPTIIDFIVKKNNIDLKSAMVERRKYAEEIIVDFVSSLPNEVASVKNAYNLFTAKYNHNIKIKKFNLILAYNNKLRNWSYKSNSIFDAFNKYITQKYTNSTINVDGLIANGKYLIILDKFLDEYGDKFGFKSPMDKKMAKEFFMTKIQIRERIKEYRQLGKFYNQYSNGAEGTKIRRLIDQGLTAQEISQQTGMPLNKINKFYRIYQLRHAPMATDQTHPSYFLNNPEEQNELV